MHFFTEPTTAMKRIILLLALGCFTLLSFAQKPAPRELPAKRVTKPVKIDGNIDEDAWKDAAIMTDLIEFRPVQFQKEDPANKTVAYLMYNNEGIYFGGYCYERTKDSIATELTGRDGFGTNDFVGIIFDTYKDHLNGFEYFVTPLGEQWDAKSSNGGNEDFSWNAVWKSAAVIHNDGWSFEFFIPYSGIRFGKKNIQDWGLNITRKRTKLNQQFMWNPVDQNINGFLTQEGYWKGLENIKPPLRLQFSPYISFYEKKFSPDEGGNGKWDSQVNGGVDVKYGINQAFTLDATLIPDFGQVQSDNLVLNLGPFAVQYADNRPFFTEGTELFNKGNLFYSRRIGTEPVFRNGFNTNPNEVVIKDPYDAKLINASKISGRTQKGLGIGFLNAISSPTDAIIRDTVTGAQRKVETNPLTNYNVFVLDQTLKHNSSVSFVNTNVWRSGSAYDANVSAVLFDLNDKKNTWNFGGKLVNSNTRLVNGYPPDKNYSGYAHFFYFGKTSGRFNFNVWQDVADAKFSNADLGYFTNSNYLSHGGWAGYKWIKPKGIYNRIFLNFNFWYNRLFSKIQPVDRMFQDAGFNVNGNMQTKKLWFFGAWMGYNFKSNDFYEPRQTGKFFERPNSLGMEVWFSNNDAKKYSFSVDVFHRRTFNFYGANSLSVSFYHSMRFNNKFSLNHQVNYNPAFNNVGFTDNYGNDIIFARRNINTVINTFGAKYNFSNKMGITFRLRHYMSTVANKQFYALMDNGKLDPNTSYNGNRDQNFNLFNIDMVYTWQFAPGSFVYLVWKDFAKYYRNEVETSYFKNFGNTIDSYQNNSLSVRVIYFIDYLEAKKKLKKKNA